MLQPCSFLALSPPLLRLSSPAQPCRSSSWSDQNKDASEKPNAKLEAARGTDTPRGCGALALCRALSVSLLALSLLSAAPQVGHPCSGKTTRALELHAHFTALGLDVTLINHESLSLSRSAMYSTPDSEKKGRSALKSTLERFLSPSPNKLLIFDYLNSIKGFRYEAWCRAREMQTTHATVYVDTPVEVCRAWNDARPEAERYSPAVFLDLCQRMEAPNAEKRWDAPLFTATYDPTTDAAASSATAAAPASAADSASSSAGSSAPSSNTSHVGKLSPALLDSLTAALLSGKVAPANISVIPARMESSNYLFELDRITSDIVKAVVDAQSGDASDGGASCQIGDSISIPGVKAPIVLLRRIHLPE